jgi:hypothetical protein
MNFRSLRTPMVLLALVTTAAMALRAADEKSKGKASQAEQPGVIKFATAPAAVQKTYKEETKGAKIELLGQGKNTEDNTSFFKAIVPVGSSDYEMAVSENGQLLEKIMNPARAEVKLEECPAVVQKALKDDSKGAKVESIERVTAGKRSDFIMNIVVQKAKYQIIFTEDGTLMSKVFDDSADAEVPSPSEPVKVSEKPEKADKQQKNQR